MSEIFSIICTNMEKSLQRDDLMRFKILVLNHIHPSIMMITSKVHSVNNRNLHQKKDSLNGKGRVSGI